MQNVKKLRNIFCVTIIALSSTIFANPSIPSNVLPGFDSIKQQNLKSDVSFLAGNKLKGRLSMDAGDQQAIEWLAAKFKQIGLLPGNNGSYLQPVKLIEYIPDRKNSYIELVRGDKKFRWKKPDVFTDFNQDINVSGNVVFAGYGITAPELNYDDYQNIDVKGKIVLVFEHEPQELNSHSIFAGRSNTIYATNKVKALNAQQHGAIAVLVAPEPNRKHPSNQERYKRIGGSTKRAIPLPLQVLAEDTLHIPVAILSDKVANKIAGENVSLSKLQSAIDKDLTPQSQVFANADVTVHDHNKSRKTGETYNVVGLLEGSDPTLKAETIIISAHHDHDGKSHGKIWHGADDNASGTAGVLSLANAFVTNAKSENGLKPKRSMLFVVFAAEERGLLGAFYMASHPLRPLASTRAMINFDMIGRNEKQSLQTKGIIDIPSDTTNRLNIIGAHYSPDYKNTIEQENKYIGLTLDERFDNEAALNVLFRSDQFPFILHQVPAFWWFTGFHPDYHQTSDTADKLNYVKMQKILRLAYLSGFEFANEETTPLFISNPAGES